MLKVALPWTVYRPGELYGRRYASSRASYLAGCFWPHNGSQTDWISYVTNGANFTESEPPFVGTLKAIRNKVDLKLRLRGVYLL